MAKELSSHTPLVCVVEKDASLCRGRFRAARAPESVSCPKVSVAAAKRGIGANKSALELDLPAGGGVKRPGISK